MPQNGQKISSIRRAARWFIRFGLRSRLALSSTRTKRFRNARLNWREFWHGQTQLHSFPLHLQVGTNLTCNLRCIFCQNYDISHLGRGEKASPSQFASHMIRLQDMGCHNINFVTPTHYTPQIVASLPEAIGLGLNLPLVYNCSGYESLEVIKLLDGIIDIYMPDTKYAGEEPAKRFSNAPDYPHVLKEVLKEMHRQVGDLQMDQNGIAQRGLLIRHLVMPEDLAGTEDLMKFIVGEISRDSYVNIMQQYRPQHKSFDYPELRRRITYGEYLDAVKVARHFGLHRGF
ncbi:MAG: radical SAM protein [Deltaproteobacteria bacterium]|nr:radical SAM protein [Deltaproteobacteria bacterium]